MAKKLEGRPLGRARSRQEIAEARMRNAGEGGEGDEIPDIVRCDITVNGHPEGEFEVSGDSLIFREATVPQKQKKYDARDA